MNNYIKTLVYTVCVYRRYNYVFETQLYGLA